MERFAEAEGRGLSTINLERHPGLDETFASNDPVAIMNLLGSIVGAPSTPDDILFLDEIQAVPAAIASLRYFLEELPALPVVAAGSLMEFALADHAFSMPVGRVDYLNLGPMTFTEFLGAVGKEGLARAINAFTWPPGEETSIPPVVHERLLSQLRLYQYVGGMPEAVRAFAESGSLRTVGDVHAGIVETYRDDFPKYGPRRDMTRMLRVFNFAARQLGRKVKFSNVSPHDQSATVRGDIDLLAMARVIAKVDAQCLFRSSAAGRPEGERLQAAVSGRGA